MEFDLEFRISTWICNPLQWLPSWVRYYPTSFLSLSSVSILFDSSNMRVDHIHSVTFNSRFSEAHFVISVHLILQDLIMGQTLGAFQFSLQIELISGPGMPLSSSLSSHAHQLFVEMSGIFLFPICLSGLELFTFQCVLFNVYITLICSFLFV